MANRVFRALLRVLPEEFRSAYARDLEVTFRSERRGLRRGAAFSLWLSTIIDLLRRAPALHLDILGRDGRLAVRTLAARPLGVVAAILTLAIGLGANIAMYAVVRTVLLAPLPYRNADTLVNVTETEAGTDPSNLGYLTFVDLRDRAKSFAALIAASQSTGTLTDPDRGPERVNAMRVSRGYFDMLGVAPALGRTFSEAEDKPGEARRVVMLSDALWRRRFGAHPDVIDTTITISGLQFRIVGVLPAGFNDLVASRLYRGAELWYPLGYDPAASFACRTCRHLRVFGRLAPGVTEERATAELNELFAALERDNPTSYHQAGARVRPLADLFFGPVRPVLLALWAGVAALLLVACGNVAHLLLLRASERAQEVAVRFALGVTRTRLVRQFMTESLILALAGGAAGLGLAWVAIRIVAAEGPAQIPRLTDVTLDAGTAVVALALTIASGVLFGLVPLRQLLRSADTTALRSGARGTDTVSTWRVRSVLVGANVGMAVVLLVGSGLLVRSMSGLLAITPGVDPTGVLTMQVWASGERFNAGETADQIAVAARFYDEVLTQARALPGVSGAAAVTTLPLGGNTDGFSVHVQGRPTPASGTVPNADRFSVTPDFFNTLRIPLVRGRYLDARDGQTADPVAVIGATTAGTLFRGEDPIGQRLMLGPANARPRTIVGIVADVRHHGLDEPVGAQVYVPHAQWAWADTSLSVVVRSGGNPAVLAGPLRDAVRAVDPAQPITNVLPYSDVVAATTGTRRFAAMLLTIFAITSVVMAVVGLYGSVSVMVAQRRREIGVRLALGATAGAVRRLVLSQGLKPVAIGLGAGLILAAFSVSALDSMLYGVEPFDVPTFIAAASALALFAVAACLPPARRASRIDPARTLRD